MLHTRSGAQAAAWWLMQAISGTAGDDGSAAHSLRGALVLSISITMDEGASLIASVAFDSGGKVAPSAEDAVAWLNVPGGTQDGATRALLWPQSVLAGAT